MVVSVVVVVVGLSFCDYLNKCELSMKVRRTGYTKMLYYMIVNVVVVIVVAVLLNSFAVFLLPDFE